MQVENKKCMFCSTLTFFLMADLVEAPSVPHGTYHMAIHAIGNQSIITEILYQIQKFSGSFAAPKLP